MSLQHAGNDLDAYSQEPVVVEEDDGFVQDPSYYDDNKDDKPGNGEEYADEMPALDPEDFWTVISSYFEGKGLVRQQLESFNEFVENTIQEIVDENSRLTLDQYTQYTGVEGDETVCFQALQIGQADQAEEI